MTKRDVTIWFCQAIAVAGIVSSAIDMFNLWGFMNWSLDLSDLREFAVHGFEMGLYFFVWLFAQGIGTELAAEGEGGEPITAARELRIVLWRCAGLIILLKGILFLNHSLAIMIFYWYSSFSLNASSTPPFYTMLPNVNAALLETGIGCYLAFTPRLHVLLRS